MAPAVLGDRSGGIKDGTIDPSLDRPASRSYREEHRVNQQSLAAQPLRTESKRTCGRRILLRSGRTERAPRSLASHRAGQTDRWMSAQDRAPKARTESLVVLSWRRISEVVDDVSARSSHSCLAVVRTVSS